jgi:hypothetical protein
MKNRTGRYVLVGLDLFLAVNAIYGAVWVVPGLPPEWLAGTPFRDYTIPGLALGIILGAGAFLSAFLVLGRPMWGVVASGVAGAGVMVFEIIETSVIGWDLWLHAFGLASIGKGLPGVDLTGIPAPLGVPIPLWQQPAYFLLGALMLALAAELWRAQRRTIGSHNAATSLRRAAHAA